MATETKIYKPPTRRSVMGRSDKLERKAEELTDKIESLYTKMTLKDKPKLYDSEEDWKQRPKKKPDYVQLRNPRSKRYIKLDRANGEIVSHKKTPYKEIPIIFE